MLRFVRTSRFTAKFSIHTMPLESKDLTSNTSKIQPSSKSEQKGNKVIKLLNYAMTSDRALELKRHRFA